MENTFLQNIKLEISRRPEMTVYERIAFHRILGIHKNAIAIPFLEKELSRGSAMRRSVLEVLSTFPQKEAGSIVKKYLKEDISENEKIAVLNKIQADGDPDDLPLLKEFISGLGPGNETVAGKAFSVFRSLCSGDEETEKWLSSTVFRETADLFTRCQAVLALSSCSNPVSIFTAVLKEKNPELTKAVFDAVYIMSSRIAAEKISSKDKNETLDLAMKLRVLLSSAAAGFDGYSRETKAAFINAMIACSHRLYTDMIIRALSDRDPETVTDILQILICSVHLLNDPTELFKHLTSVSFDRPEHNRLLVDVFVKMFSSSEDRKLAVLRDRIAGYISIILARDFEDYRKEYSKTDLFISSISEENLPVIQFIMNRMDPALKNELYDLIRSGKTADIPEFLSSMSEFTSSVQEKEIPAVQRLISLMFSQNSESRDNFLSALEKTDYNRQHIRSRLIRHCRVIGQLGITGSASRLVNIYNYLLKYPDPVLSAVLEDTLAELKYSWLTGETEVMLSSRDEEVQKRGLHLLSYFDDHHSSEIIFNLLRRRDLQSEDLTLKALEILENADLERNLTANELFKQILERTDSQEIQIKALLLTGRCCLNTDYDYLNSFFYKTKNGHIRAAVVRSILCILEKAGIPEKYDLIKNLKEYLKDPDIRVRLYADICLLVLHDETAAASIREMLIIKQKSIQREIISVIGRFPSIELSFFLLSCLKEEYGIMNEILDTISLLPSDDLTEVDQFIISMFKKHEEEVESSIMLGKESFVINLESMKHTGLTLFNVYLNKPDKKNYHSAIRSSGRLYSLFLPDAEKNEGTAALFSRDRFQAAFTSPAAAMRYAWEISEKIHRINEFKNPENHVSFSMQSITCEAIMINDEVIFFPSCMISPKKESLMANTVLTDELTAAGASGEFLFEKNGRSLLPEDLPGGCRMILSGPANFLKTAMEFFLKLRQKKEQEETENLNRPPELPEHTAASGQISGAVISDRLEAMASDLMDSINAIDQYLQKTTPDRELRKNVHEMLIQTYNRFRSGISGMPLR